MVHTGEAGMYMLTLVYLVAAKMSSNFFFRVCPSDSGQLLSSWCTKMTFSKMACRVVSSSAKWCSKRTCPGFLYYAVTFETPMSDGTMRSMSAHLYDKACFWPVSLLKVCSVWSSVLNCRAVFFCVSCRYTAEHETDSSCKWQRKVRFQASFCRHRLNAQKHLDLLLASMRGVSVVCECHEYLESAYYYHRLTGGSPETQLDLRFDLCLTCYLRRCLKSSDAPHCAARI